MKKISVITINLNNAEGLARTIKSVTEQDYTNYEFIVIDGASTDNSIPTIESARSKINKVVIEKDTGIYDAMNKGIKYSEGEYLLFLNSGDYFAEKSTLLQCSQYLFEADVIGGRIIKIVDGKEHLLNSPHKITVDWFVDVSLHHQATFIKKELFEKHGVYNATYKLGGDYEFFVRTLLKERGTYKNIPVTVCFFPTDGISNQPTWLKINLEEKERTWSIHFGKNISNEIEQYILLKSSKEIKWGRRVLNKLFFLKKQ